MGSTSATVGVNGSVTVIAQMFPGCSNHGFAGTTIGMNNTLSARDRDLADILANRTNEPMN